MISTVFVHIGHDLKFLICCCYLFLRINIHVSVIMLTINSIRLPIVISVDVLDPEGDDKKQNHDVRSC